MPVLTEAACHATQAEVAVDPRTLARVLAPYKPHCHYLRTATVHYVMQPHLVAVASGRFSIPESCYIANTGHFNAVEFNICYNQLMYCLLAQCIQDHALESLSAWTLADFGRRQLADFLIARFFSSFHKPLGGESFGGRIEVVKVAVRRSDTFMKTTCRFYDEGGGRAEGGATIAIINSASVPIRMEDLHGGSHDER